MSLTRRGDRLGQAKTQRACLVNITEGDFLSAIDTLLCHMWRPGALIFTPLQVLLAAGVRSCVVGKSKVSRSSKCLAIQSQ
jgi:hypothetical protein